MMTLTTSLEETAKKHPNRIAVVIKKEEITYSELYVKSMNLAKSIISMGVERGDRIGFLFPKSIESVISIYGIMMSGACYVPLDIKSPVDRLQSILTDCNIKILITSKTKTELEFLKETQVKTVITTKEFEESTEIKGVSWLLATEKNDTPITLPIIDKDDLSYILYTSGSTGVPKGIVHTHKSASSFALWGANEFDLTEKDVVSNHAPYHFDLSTFDLFASCLVGAKMIIIPEYLTKFPTSISKLILSEKISVWYSVPSALIQLIQRGTLDIDKTESLRVVLFAGEVFPVQFLQDLRNVLKDNTILANLYGPTETNVCTSYTLNQKISYTESLSIGIPCKGFDCKIVDANNNEVPKGHKGELLIKGPHVMKEYWNREDLNNKSFTTVKGELYYKTGDYVTTLPNDTLSFLGRKDRQIKLRGFRVELDALEHIFQGIKGVQEIAVFTVGQGDSMSIKASVVVDNESMEDALYEELFIKTLSSVLPPYAVPSKIEILKELPKTSTGKIDRQKLILETHPV